MTTLDPRFICSSDLEGVFLDKLTGLPLAAGIITFYSDDSQSLKKTIYQLSNSAPYTFTPLSNPITLNSIGGYQDSLGNSIVIYYFPYHCTTDGDPTTSTGALELYYVTVENSGNTQQFTRHAWPPLASNLVSSSSGNDGVKNYIPNGQFLSHNDHPITDATTQSGLDILQIAQGGWSFKKMTGGTGVYTVSFNDEVTTRSANLNDYPFSSININCSSFGTETTHDLVVQWPDVNTFQTLKSTPPDKGSQINTFNLMFAAKVTSGTQQFRVFLISNYGTGGSTQISTELSTSPITLTANYQYFNIPISATDLPDNSAKTIGAGSFVAIAIRTPTNAFIGRFTDFALTLDKNVTYSAFPIMTEDEMLSRGVAGWMPTPNPDGSDLYLPLVLTNKGMIFDHSIVGQIIAKTQVTALPGELPMNTTGGAVYVASATNTTTGIPYSRLMNYLLLNSPAVSITAGAATILANTIPLTGTGPQFVTLFNEAAQPTHFLVQMNTTAAGGVATQVSASITIAATSANNYYTATVASVPAASNYWTFTAPTSGLVYNVWYSLDGAGAAPATPTGANIQVALVTGDPTTTVANKTIAAVNQYQFYIPNLAGLFLRGLDPTGIYDPDFASRTVVSIKFNGTAFTGATGAKLGSLEGQAFLNHVHSPTAGSTYYIESDGSSAGVTTGSNNFTLQALTGGSPSGGTETRPVNWAINYFIKY